MYSTVWLAEASNVDDNASAAVWWIVHWEPSQSELTVFGTTDDIRPRDDDENIILTIACSDDVNAVWRVYVVVLQRQVDQESRTNDEISETASVDCRWRHRCQWQRVGDQCVDRERRHWWSVYQIVLVLILTTTDLILPTSLAAIRNARFLTIFHFMTGPSHYCKALNREWGGELCRIGLFHIGFIIIAFHSTTKRYYDCFRTTHDRYWRTHIRT